LEIFPINSIKLNWKIFLKNTENVKSFLEINKDSVSLFSIIYLRLKKQKKNYIMKVMEVKNLISNGQKQAENSIQKIGKYLNIFL